jgi:hypothetical protein
VSKRIAERVLVGKPVRKRPLGRHWHRWEDNIKMYLTETGWKGVNLTHLDQDRAK